MSNKEELDRKTREELYSIKTHLNITNDKIKSKIILLKFISINYQKYYKYFDEISETFLSKEVMNARKQLKQWINLSGKQCSVKLNKLELNEKQFKGKTNTVIYNY